MAESMDTQNDIRAPLMAKMNQQLEKLRTARRLHAIITHHGFFGNF